MKRSDLRGIVFDLDGTLCHYEVGIAEAIANSLTRTGNPGDMLGALEGIANRFDDLWREYESRRGNAAEICFRAFRELLIESGSPDELLAGRLSEIYSRIRLASVALYPGVQESLAALRPCYRMGLLTNGPSDLQWSKIRRLSIEPLFDTIVVAGDVGRYKPDARAFRLTAKQLGLRGDEIIFVGDSPFADIAGARAAGFYSAWLRNPRVEIAPEIAADLVIDDLRELRKVLL